MYTNTVTDRHMHTHSYTRTSMSHHPSDPSTHLLTYSPTHSLTHPVWFRAAAGMGEFKDNGSSKTSAKFTVANTSTSLSTDTFIDTDKCTYIYTGAYIDTRDTDSADALTR